MVFTIEKLLNFFTGYVVYNVFCPNSNPFSLIRILNESADIIKINKVTGNYVSFICKAKHRSLALQCIEYCGGEIRSEKQAGLNLIVKKAYERMGLVAGGLFCVAVLLLSQMFIWEIRVVGNEKIDENEIISTLSYLGFSEGCLKSKIDIDKLNNEFLLCENRVSWMSVNIKGNVAYVEISEREFPPDKRNKDARVNIVAERDGVILRVDAYEGGKQVKEGDIVSKGQLLISAFFDTKDGNVFFTNARGVVYANTVRNFEVRVNKKIYEKSYTGKTKEEYSLKLLGREIPLHFDTHINFKNYDKDISENNIKFLSSKLPLKLKCKTYNEYVYKETTLTEKQARQKALSLLLSKISKEIKKGEVISMSTQYESLNNCVIIRCSANCAEDIAKEQQVYVKTG